MNREHDTVFLQTIGKFIVAQVQLATVPLLQKIESLETVLHSRQIESENISKELDGAIEGFAAEIARVEKLIIPGKDADMDALFAYVENYMKAIPLPQNGKDGKDGMGKDGEMGPMGPAGRDGADVVAAFRDSDGHLVLTLSNGVTKDVGLIHGRDGKDGLPGKDGLGFRDMSAVWDGERTLIFKFVLEDRVEELSVTIPVVLFRGAWKRGEEYKQGDNVICEGSSWIALRDTDKQPGTADQNETGWIMAVRRGTNGTDGKQGKQGPPGKDGLPGRDLTQMGFDGKKW